MIENIKESLGDIGKDTKSIILDRLKNPFLNFYIFFLIIINWDILLIFFFGAEDMIVRVSNIKNLISNEQLTIFNNDISFINKRWFFPLIYSVTSLIIYPFLIKELEIILKDITIKRNTILYEINKHNEIKKSELNAIISGNKTVTDLNKEIDNLKSEIEEFKDLDVINKDLNKAISNHEDKEKFLIENLELIIDNKLMEIFSFIPESQMNIYKILDSIMNDTFTKNFFENIDIVNKDKLKDNFYKNFGELITPNASSASRRDLVYRKFLNELIDLRVIKFINGHHERGDLFDIFKNFIGSKNLPF